MDTTVKRKNPSPTGEVKITSQLEIMVTFGSRVETVRYDCTANGLSHSHQLPLALVKGLRRTT